MTALSGSDLAAHEHWFEQCTALWLRAFAGAPWHASPAGLDGRRTTARRQLNRDGTRAVLAHDGDDVVGAAWGWDGDRSPDDALHRAVRDAVGPELARRLWAADATVVVELMVDPARQGEGTGGRLLRALVGERASWLLSHPDGAGLPLYFGRGWVAAGRIEHGGTPLLVLARDAVG